MRRSFESNFGSSAIFGFLLHVVYKCMFSPFPFILYLWAQQLTDEEKHQTKENNLECHGHSNGENIPFIFCTALEWLYYVTV